MNQKFGCIRRIWASSLAFLILTVLLAACGGSSGGGGGSIDTNPANGNGVKGIVYVSPTGDDANDGTKDHPMATIPAAIDKAANQNYIPGEVWVPEGTYQVNSDPSTHTHVVLAEGISLYGGYSADFSQRDPAANITTIQDISAAAAAANLPNRVIEAGSGVTAATIVDGFTIQGGGGGFSSGVFAHDGGSFTIVDNIIDGGGGSTYSYGIYNSNFSTPSIKNNTIAGGQGSGSSYGIFNTSFSSPSIQNNTIDGGGQGSGSSYGIYNLSSSSPLIQNNTINGGGGTSNSSGIYNNSFSSPLIQNNTIDGGGGGSGSSYGISNSASSSPLIQNNTIDGGGGGSGSSYGIYNLGFSSSIQNNTIDGGGGAASIGIAESVSSSLIQNNTIDGGRGSTYSYGIYNNSSSSSIQNNIVFTSGSGVEYCISESNASSDPISIRNNDLFNCSTAFYRDEATTDLTSIDDVNALVDTNSGGNVSVDPAFADVDGPDNNIDTMADNDWHLSSSSPDQVTQGGLDLSSLFPTDKDGVTRTVSWSMGAYERDN
jgi:hypothetical protein